MFYNLLSEKTKVKMKQLLEEMGHKNLSSEMVVEEYFAHTFGESMEIKSLSEIFNENNFLSLLEENMPNEIKDTFRQIIKTIKNGNGKKMYLDKRETTFRSSTTQNDNYPQRIVEEDGEGIGTSVNRGGNRRFGETGMGTVPETVSGGLQGISRGKEKFQTGSSLERTVGGYFQRGLEEEGLDPDDTFSDDNTVMDEADYLELEREFKEIFDLSPYPSPQERGAVSGESSFYYNVAAPQRPIRNDFENELDYQEATIIYNRNREIQREIERLDRETGFESVFYETIEDYIKQNKDYIHVQENSITNIAGAFNRRTKKIEFILPNLYDDYLSNRIEEVYMHEFVHAELYSSLYIDLVDRLNKMIEDSPIDIQVKFGDYLSEKGYKVFTTYMIVDEMLAFSISETA
ncbi:MAG: hypothetical protein LBE56_12495 [Tannerella sp.]|jgi:hypothetical protein|nr:hypothetical protein [Tannerella sp.]